MVLVASRAGAASTPVRGGAQHFSHGRFHLAQFLRARLPRRAQL